MGGIATSVFITTPTLKELKHRLYLRKTDTKSSITKRIKNAKQEIQYIKEYDYLIINDDLKKAAKELVSIAKIAKLKTKLFNKKNIAKYWLK
jgi:guanylate kinase